jgi:hypothetical protein
VQESNVAVPEAYSPQPGNIPKFLDAIQTAGVPSRVTVEFLKTLGFKSSNDRSLIRILKAIGFLDDNGTPTARYRDYRDPDKAGTVLADALRTAYDDVFLANTKAHDLSAEKLKGIIATKTNKGDRAVMEIARTFQALTKKADFAAVTVDAKDEVPVPELPVDNRAGSTPAAPLLKRSSSTSTTTFHYNIQIHLPTTTDITVYNAIFKSLRDNLL